ncbi:FAD-binding oxidoreductase [Actinospica sp. MGRD01-02]|uniref:FAD-binding oxidoreductase n=1 Tax=Actinospica acidithermotolerans TaxID=2828514 RepID=A0A941E4Y0_9ACTN|nr:FAD-binding oxidoreductase [Actinospica acidithermotolerans]MBR7825196.1 FAD-binding oxidoreductase [Actinospica acidithermotolerans]
MGTESLAGPESAGRTSPPTRERLSGWGRTSPSVAEVLRPRSREEIAEAVTTAGPRGIVARGLGRSYGDPAQNGGGRVLDLTGMNRILAVDLDTGQVVVEPGVSLHQLMEAMLPFGYFVPVTPGTRHVTVGGAIACDIHGKSHHADGSFAQHVVSMDLLLADGGVRTLTPESEPELFWATAGGMGLTGVVLRATLRMLPVETSRILVETKRVADLDEAMARMTETDADHRFSVASLDNLATGPSLGRGWVESGNFATVADLPAKQRENPLAFHPKPVASMPDLFPSGLLNRRTIRLMNLANFRRAPQNSHTHIASIGGFFHPLDAIHDWNRVYGPAGFLQYQFVVPFDAASTLRRIVERVAVQRAPSFVTVLKRFGPASPGYLSFPTEGWTLTYDFPTGTPGLPGLLRWMDGKVLEAGGRLYLAKDSRMSAADLEAMYPRLEAFRKVRAAADPQGVFVSDQSRRLSL